MKTIELIYEDAQNPFFVLLSLIFAFFKSFFLKYVFDDFEFANFLLWAIILDTVLGVFLAIRRKDIDTDAFGKMAEKIVIYAIILSFGHLVSNYTIDGQRELTFIMVKNTLYSGMIIREGISIMSMAGRRYPGLFKNVLKYFRSYSEQGIPNSK